jgi:hypothetical protein
VSRRLNGWPDPPVYDEERLWDTVDVLLNVAADHGASPAQVALAYLLDKPGVSSVIVGARTTEQLTDNLEAANLKLTTGEREELEQVSAPPLLYPYWWQAKYDNRLGAADLALLGRYLAETAAGEGGRRLLPGFGKDAVAHARHEVPERTARGPDETLVVPMHAGSIASAAPRREEE